MLRKTGVGFLLSLVFVLFAYSSAVAEWYAGGAVGLSIGLAFFLDFFANLRNRTSLR